jgi:hypothetical protein
MVKQLMESPMEIGQVPTEQVAALNWLINQAIVNFDKNSYHLFSPLLAKFLGERIGLEPAEALATRTAASNHAAIFESLTPKEADLLRYFQEHSHTVLSTEQLLADVWNQPEASPRRVQEAIRRLRNSLNKQTPPIGFVKNERGAGYRYIPNLKSE